MTDLRWNADDLGAIASLLREIDICMLVTQGEDGPRGRPMSNNGEVEFDGDCWFFTLRDTEKVRQVEGQPHVELAYIATERGSWISLEGTASIVDDIDRKRALWSDELRAWFPDGPDDEAVVLLKVAADRVHAWGGDGETIHERGRTVRRIED